MNDLLTSDDQVQQQFDDSADYFVELVGEGKKFKDERELAKGKYLADSYIKDLERQKDELRKDLLDLRSQYDARAKLEELIDQVGTMRNSSDDNQNVRDITAQPPSMKPEDIDSLIEQRLSKRELAQRETQNLNEAKKMLRDKLGNNFAQVVRERIEDLEISEEDVNTIAKRSPKMLARLLSLEDTQQDTLFQSPPTSQRRNDSFRPRVEKKTWSYWQNLKKTNPRLYLDPKTAVEMHNAHIALGSAFEDGDFHSNI